MRILCLGNNTKDTDKQASVIAHNNGLENLGLITDLEGLTDLNQSFKDAVYHSSVYDMTPGRITLLAKKFNRVVVLDQPKECWSHPDAYLNTVNLVKTIKNLEFLNPVTSSLGYWKNLVDVNKSFCIFPFIELLVDNGSTTVCCRSRKEITTLENLKDFNTDRHYSKIRSAMLNGELLEHCQVCYRDEQNGLLSARQQETVEWANRLNLDSVGDLMSIDGPVYYEVRPSNNCNLQCRICTPHFSKLIQAEYNKIGLHDTTVTYKYSNFDFVDLNKVKKLYVAGGEPTAMPEFYEFLRNSILQKQTDFEFIVNTNAHKISSVLLDLGREFSNLQYIVSIDGFGKANEYSRWPSNWDNQISNIHRLINNGHKVTFNVVVSVYTIFSFAQLITFLQSEFPGCLIHAQYAHGRQYPFVIEYKASVLESVVELQHSEIYHGNNLFRSFVDTTIANIRQSSLDQTKLAEFFKFNDLLDRSRSVKLEDYIPELEAYRNEC